MMQSAWKLVCECFWDLRIQIEPKNFEIQMKEFHDFKLRFESSDPKSIMKLSFT